MAMRYLPLRCISIWGRESVCNIASVIFIRRAHSSATP